MLEQFLNFIHTDGWLEIRLIGNGRSIPKFYESVDEVINDLNYLKSQNEEGFNVYYGVLPRKEKPEKGGGKEHVIDKADKLWLDVDVFSTKNPEEYVNLSDEEIKQVVLENYQKAKKILNEAGINITACVYSGRGFQPIIRLNEEVTKEEIEKLNKALIKFLRNHGFKVDSAWDCARILRLPEFYNVKDKEKPLKAELIELNDNITNLEVVRDLAEKLQEEEDKKKGEKRQAKSEDRGFINDLGISLDAVRQIDKKLNELLTTIEHPDYPSPSEADMACASKLYYWRFDESQIVEILRAYRYRNKLERDDYIELTLSKIERERFNPAENPHLFLKLVKITEDLSKKSMSRVIEKQSTKRSDFQGDVHDVWDVYPIPNFKLTSESYNKIKDNVDIIDTIDISKDIPPICEYSNENLDMAIELEASYFFDKDRFNAKRLADLIMSQVRFVTLRDTEEVWYYKDGIFRPNGETIIKELCQHYLGEEANKNRVSEVIAHIQRSTYIDRSAFDKNINLIAVENGVLNLETMELLPHSPDYLLTVKIPVEYNPEADCPKIKQFFSEVLHPDEIPVIEELFGYCLYRRYFIHKAFMFVGSGRNGKSTLLRLLERFLGMSNVSHVPLQAFAESRFAVAELYGKLANIYADLSSQALRDTGLFKTLTGEDSIEAERKFKNPFRFVNYAKLIYSCNKLPETYDDSDAFFARWIIINFPNKFEGEKADKKLIDKLTTKEELSGLLNLALAGLKRLLEKGEFSKGISTDEMRELYLRMSDPVAAFIMDCVEVSTEEYIAKKELYSSFCEYCRRKNYPTVSEATFHKKLLRHVRVEDYRPKIGGKRIYAWRGIRLVESKENENEDEDPFTIEKEGEITFYICKACGFRTTSEEDVEAHLEVCEGKDFEIEYQEWDLSEMIK